jgi:small GTP-binding protein
MPTNLPPEYFAAEKRYREAKTIQEKITSLEELMGTIPKHKGTDKLRADLRRRLSKLKSSAETKKKTGKHESIFHIEREGAGRVVFVGPPNVGKSSLLEVLTNANPKISEYPFTTWIPLPGMMTYENIQIQLVDTPPLIREHIETELMDLIRNADVLLLLVDLQADPLQQLQNTLQLLVEFRITPACIKRTYNENTRISIVPSLIVVNKHDDTEFDEDFQVFCELLEEECQMISVSAQTNYHLEELKSMIFKQLNIIRIYSKPPGKEVDFTSPFVMKRGGTLNEFAGKVHKDFAENLKSARVWGQGVFDGQLVGRDHILEDGDIVELHI